MKNLCELCEGKGHYGSNPYDRCRDCNGTGIITRWRALVLLASDLWRYTVWFEFTVWIVLIGAAVTVGVVAYTSHPKYARVMIDGCKYIEPRGSNRITHAGDCANPVHSQHTR